MGRQHKVPLSEPALAILRDMARVKLSRYVFPGGKAGKPLSNMALLALLGRMGRDDLTVHGFRATFRTWAQEQTNFPREVAERALAHAKMDKTEASYARSDLLEKRRRLMDAWAQYCATPATKVGQGRAHQGREGIESHRRG